MSTTYHDETERKETRLMDFVSFTLKTSSSPINTRPLLLQPTPQWGTVDTEINISSAEISELSKGIAWNMLEYNLACFA